MATLVSIARTLFLRRRQPARWLFALASLPLALFSLAGYEYGASPLYAVLAGVCILQAVWPTLAGWGLSLAIYGAGAVMYLDGTISAGAADIGGSIVMLFLCLAVGIPVLLLRPVPFPQKS